MTRLLETPEVLFFDKIKEGRSWYFVEYFPPNSGYRFASLSIVVTEDGRSDGEIAEAVEAEMEIWLRRYPIPIMASAFDANGDLVGLGDARKESHLMGYLSASSGEIISAWRLMSNSELPGDALDNATLKATYSNIPFRTKEQIRTKVDLDTKRMRAGFRVITFWAVGVPLAVAILEWWSDWLGYIVLAYAFCKAIEKTLRLKGKLPKSKAQVEREAEELRMRHHHYHCERNPEGFNRLKIENFEKASRERIAEEAAALKVTEPAS